VIGGFRRRLRLVVEVVTERDRPMAAAGGVFLAPRGHGGRSQPSEDPSDGGP